MRESEKIESILELAAKLKDKGFRVFVSNATGTYGFYTDASGARVVYFQINNFGMHYSGCYGSASGWGLEHTGNYTEMLYTYAPTRVSKPDYLAYTTLDTKLQLMGSQYTEYMGDTTQ
jgi:hypothetical protein